MSKNATTSLFDKELQDAIDGKLPENHIFSLGVPGEILQKCGFPKGQRIEMSLSRLKFKAGLSKHSFDLTKLFGLEKALQEPVSVFEYGDKSKSQNVLIDLTDGKNHFLAGIHFNQTARGLAVSDIRTVFPKETFAIMNWVNQGAMIYGNNKKIQALIAQQRTNVAEVNKEVAQRPLYEHCLDSVSNILSKFGTVNDIFTDEYPFYKDVKLHGEIEKRFFTYYTSKGNLDARELATVEADEFYTALKNNDQKKINEYMQEEFHEVNEIATEILSEYSKEKNMEKKAMSNYYKVNEKFAVEFVPANDSNFNVFNTEKGDDWIVRFYDTSQKKINDFGRNGQFVSSYYASTILEDKQGVGLLLDGGNPSWKVDGKTMDYVQELTNKWLENHKEKSMENTKKEITAKELQIHIENLKIKHPSKWAEAVKEDAVDLVGNYIEWHGEDAPFKAENAKDLLNGAKDWKQYSEGGLALVFNYDIAKHYCTQSELKQLGFEDGRYVKEQPNANETWLDVQSRALFQASELVKKSVRDMEMKKTLTKQNKSRSRVELQSKAIDVVNKVEKRLSKTKSKDEDFGMGR